MTTIQAIRMALFVAAIGVTLSVDLAAQADKKDAKKAAPGAAPATPKVNLPAPPPNFEYAPQGRRDPFITLVNRGIAPGGNAANPLGKRPEGVPGLLTNEVAVRGILQSKGQWIAMVSGPDGKIFTVRAGDKLADGVIRTVTAQFLVILQEVNDPLSLEKQREVRKFLRGGEEVK